METAIVTMTSKDARRAMVIASRTGNAFVAGMQTGVVGFTFLKADNKTIAHRYGTTMASLAKRHINGRGICGDARNVVVFWDVEAEGENKWRSFRIEKLISID